MEYTKDKIKVSDLPCKIRIALPPKPGSFLDLALTGVFVFIVGTIFVIFGPFPGPDFFVSLQSYPGSLSIIGCFIVMSSFYLENVAKKIYSKRIQKTVNEMIDLNDSDMPESMKLNIESYKKYGEFFELSLVHKSVEEKLVI
ncbi:hypothetical protein MED121_12060 [Marinomonas sp. MED121]|uniref:hypothetical protein n=1 Tax=Marinomonas sp. MED121 TaxID=314277 RepID=UPI000068FFB1|nr:hypothetical protein [Marinomonas sp. MED121]EAQ66658.1 hypothetical protein MED121_12060 [Marinomonas sp. MED121]